MVLRDGQLDALETQVTAANQDLKAASPWVPSTSRVAVVVRSAGLNVSAFALRPEAIMARMNQQAIESVAQLRSSIPGGLTHKLTPPPARTQTDSPMKNADEMCLITHSASERDFRQGGLRIPHELLAA
jgi:hypothetical protein